MLITYTTLILNKIFSNSLSTVLLNHYPLLVIRNKTLPYLSTFFSILKLSSATRLNTLVELTAYDVPNRFQRFTLNFFMLSVEYNYRIALNLNIAQTDFVPTLFNIYPNSS